MIKPRFIARLDIKNEYLIKSIQLEGLKKIGDPNEYAIKYYKAGVDEIIFMDVVASLYGRNNLFEVIKKNCKKYIYTCDCWRRCSIRKRCRKSFT